MPNYATRKERELYMLGYMDGRDGEPMMEFDMDPLRGGRVVRRVSSSSRPKRKMSAWNKYVKANSKKPRFRYRNGKLNLKKMGVAFRKTPAGRKKK